MPAHDTLNKQLVAWKRSSHDSLEPCRKSHQPLHRPGILKQRPSPDMTFASELAVWQPPSMTSARYSLYIAPCQSQGFGLLALVTVNTHHPNLAAALKHWREVQLRLAVTQTRALEGTNPNESSLAYSILTAARDHPNFTLTSTPIAIAIS